MEKRKLRKSIKMLWTLSDVNEEEKNKVRHQLLIAGLFVVRYFVIIKKKYIYSTIHWKKSPLKY